MATRNLNKVMLIGNLTRDPELRYTPQGNAVASFVIATNREWVAGGEKKQAADFHNVVAWNKLAEICSQLLKRGTKVFVEGRLQTRSWQDTDGSKKYKTEIIIDDMIILTKKNAEGDMEDADTDEGAVPFEADAAGTEIDFDSFDLDLDNATDEEK
ncbi:single-stranded DNA-binding protein [candidate division WWE3 bacterium]|uniref:Single-stranded DNA-binding protein n=1 Tax=candidate division WWE3 bacterium TaxID=2053526 RepID=A0A3A4ZK90_UNCKA|nr:MAG: single-stranded DNA-binding protein [candidate division WWE3 bacterium]